ncbi:hypothetical protein [Shinella zoogloeoides]|uniref:hypothetical protein n=1 Tax=Shinella zoogloeoides TaxID=352475 RepID=UPI0028A71DB6|nr:hypothetical protein [Shinella zoogloeoides]
MIDASHAPLRFKIDRGDRTWRFKVYERVSFLGFKYWACVRKTDYLEIAEEFIRDCQKLPRFYR